MAKKTLTSEQMMTAILAYLGILVLIPLFAVKKRDEFIRFHLRQGIVLFVIEIIIWVAAAFLLFPFGFFAFGWLMNLIGLAILIVIVIAIIRAVQGDMWEMPIVSNFTNMVKI